MMQSGFVSNIFLSSFLSEEKLFFWQRQDWLFSRRYELWWVPINRFGPWFHPSILFPAHQSAEEGEGDQGSSPLPSWTATTLTSASPGAAQPRPRTSMTVPRRTRLTFCGFGWRLDLVCVAALAAHWQGSPEAEPTGGAARPESYGRWASTKCRLASRHIQPHAGA